MGLASHWPNPSGEFIWRYLFPNSQFYIRVEFKSRIVSPWISILGLTSVLAAQPCLPLSSLAALDGVYLRLLLAVFPISFMNDFFFSEINTVIRVYNKTFVFWARYISFSIWILVCLLELTSADHHAFEAVRSALPSLSHSMLWKQCVPFLSLRLNSECRAESPWRAHQQSPTQGSKGWKAPSLAHQITRALIL